MSATPTTLAETWTQAQADAPIDPRATPAVQARRDYMRGALDCLLLLKAGVTREQLLAECVAFGRAVGTAAERAEWEHLLRYGYAPGKYMNTCRCCGEVAHNVDKRALCCRPCAEARHAMEEPPCQQCGAMTDDEAAQKCLGAAAGDDCHGNHLWPT